MRAYGRARVVSEVWVTEGRESYQKDANTPEPKRLFRWGWKYGPLLACGMQSANTGSRLGPIAQTEPKIYD